MLDRVMRCTDQSGSYKAAAKMASYNLYDEMTKVPLCGHWRLRGAIMLNCLPPCLHGYRYVALASVYFVDIGAVPGPSCEKRGLS